MLSTYRRILTRPGTLRFSAAALVGRIPISMIGLGIVLLVSSITGSYGLAGSVSAAFLVASAALSVAQGRLLDRWGQARVLTAAVLVNSAGLVVLMAAVQLDWPRSIAYASSAVAGAALPAVGASVRARWSHVLDDPAEVQTAYALESVLDEVVFIVGPILVTVLATAWHPVAGLATAVLIGLGGTLWYAAQRDTQPVPSAHASGDVVRPAMPWAAMAAIAVLSVGLGALFGSAEVTTVAFTDDLGLKRWSGFLLALWSAGSLIAGVVTGAVHWRRSPGIRLRYGSTALAATMVPLPLIGSLPVLGMALFVGGFAIAPTLIATNSLTEQVVPRARLAEGMAIVHTGIAGGVAAGAAVAGLVIDARGASTAYLVAFAAGLLAAVASYAAPR